LSGLGDEPSAFLGALIINSFKQAAEAATDPQPYDLFIDEFAHFGSSTVASILSEARKWKLNLTVAHQFLTQISEQVRDVCFGNCSTLISFRIGAEDAPIIGRALDWNPHDLQDLPIGRARYTALINGQRSGALTGRERTSHGLALSLKKASPNLNPGTPGHGIVLSQGEW
jgi:hypothetical protein